MIASATSCHIYQLRVVLCGISPLIWRRVLVRSKTTLAQLHTILQVVFAWSVVTITDNGQETTREIACVERPELTPETLGLSLAEGKAVLQAMQAVMVK